jgi:hypothetical protein
MNGKRIMDTIGNQLIAERKANALYVSAKLSVIAISNLLT